VALTLKGLINSGKALGKTGKKNLFIIPFFFTFSSAIFGLFSVIKTFQGDFVLAAYFIMFAGIMDAFDGRLARALGSSSYLGMELDSLCDAVSFCFAPTVLLYCWYFQDVGLWAISVLALYLCCGLLRLAKFNIISSSDQKDIGFFIGLPTTLAAFLIAQLVINYHWISIALFPFLKNPLWMTVFIAIVALLMVSSVRFLSFKKVSLRLSFFTGLTLLFLSIFSFLLSVPFFFLIIFSYISSCVLYFFIHKIFQ